MENFIITMTYLLAGVAVKRIPDFPSETGKVLNLFVIYFSLPALILIKIPELKFDENLLITAVVPWLCLVFSVVVILLFSKTFRWERDVTGCLLLLIPLGNTAFFGLPMVNAFYGDKGAPFALLYDQAGTFIAFTTYGSFILALYGKNTSKPTPANILKKILVFPPFIALIAAFILKNTPYPQTFSIIIETLASTLVPLVMIAVGYQLSLRLGHNVKTKLFFGLALKLIMMPVFALFICKISGFNSFASKISVFQAGMPSMVTAGAMAIMADIKPALAAALVGSGIVLSFATLPLIFNLINILI
ncbi:MAG: AEC family transporter [Desulfobacteraceae bacterium]|jgi:predicted permease